MQRTWDQATEHGERRGPYDGVTLSGADVFWLAARALAGADAGGDIAAAEGRLRAARDDWKVRSSLDLSALHLEGADLSGAHLERATLWWAHLEEANLREAHLAGAILIRAHLDGKTDLSKAVLAKRASLRDRLLRRTTSAALGDIRWGGVGTVDLTAVRWDDVWRLGDEREVGFLDDADDHEQVVRAYRQLAAQLRAQGMSEVADRFTHRAQMRQRGVLLRRVRLGQWLFSWLLSLLAGYGYRPMRTIFWYVAVVAGFAWGYFQVTHGAALFDLHEPAGTQMLKWYEALVLSVASFHGQGFFPQGINLGDPVAILAASEAVIGLFIEISFIATFTQRFFGAR